MDELKRSEFLALEMRVIDHAFALKMLAVFVVILFITLTASFIFSGTDDDIKARIEKLESHHTLPDKTYACNRINDRPFAFECYFEVWDYGCIDNIKGDDVDVCITELYHDIILTSNKWHAVDAYKIKNGCVHSQLHDGDFMTECPDLPGQVECWRLWYYEEQSDDHQ